MSFGPPPSMPPGPATAPDPAVNRGGRHGLDDSGGPGRKRPRKLLTGLLAVILAGVLGTGGWLLWGRGGNGSEASGTSPDPVAQGPLDVRETVEKQPASSSGKMAFRFSVDDMKPGEHVEMPGMWATDRILAKGINKTVVGLGIGTDAAPGDEKWRLALDGPICGYTRDVTGDHRTAVLFRANDWADEALCNQVAFVDLDDGRLVWEAKFPVSRAGRESADATGTDKDRPGVALAPGTVAVTWGGGTIGYDMKSGDTRWSTTTTAPCQDMGVAGGRGLMVREQCWSGEDPGSAGVWQSTTYKLRKVDPATGESLWWYSLAKGVRDVHVPSVDPPVVAVSAGDSEVTDLISLDGRGHNRATISLRNGAYVAECLLTDYLQIDDCPTIAVGKDQVFIRSKDQPELPTWNWIIGFDLATGRTTRKFDSGPGALLYPVRMSGDQLLALSVSEDHIAPNALVALDPGTDEAVPYLYFDVPDEARLMTMAEHNDIVVQNGRLFFGVKSADGPADAKTKQWTYLVLGIGSSAQRKP
ncbi:PQQ-binding-like beta-propeller repeat protein [Streptomyces hyderabadensis]|uniref:PQQ-binding-like beta-propeller repeat protein n=1 Tax=Streptomyces hyderabadensis TaxID=598549 RepID=A0ABP9HU40_9ACTN|nr:PQQ-binding-like beta-propeller repeat protein [Streptomyces hyderabadensis]